MAQQNPFSVRLDDETTAMLNELDRLYRNDADDLGVSSNVSKNQIIK